MTGIGRNFGKALAAMTVAGGILFAHVSAAGASANCDSYAKLTVQQAKRNLTLRCGYSGPRWSLDVNRHRAWCAEVGPAGWRAELKVRDEMLAKCQR